MQDVEFCGDRGENGERRCQWTARLQSLELERGLEMQKKRKPWGCCCRRYPQRPRETSGRNIPSETLPKPWGMTQAHPWGMARSSSLGNDQGFIPEHAGSEDPLLKGKTPNPSCQHSQTGQLQTPSSPVVLSTKQKPSPFLCFFLTTITDLAEGRLHPPLLGSSFPIPIRRGVSSSESGSVEEDGSSSRWSW